MSESVEIDSKKLKVAYDDLDSLVMVVRGQAKTARDEFMESMCGVYQDFRFDQHRGYVAVAWAVSAAPAAVGEEH